MKSLHQASLVNIDLSRMTSSLLLENQLRFDSIHVPQKNCISVFLLTEIEKDRHSDEI